MFRFPSVICTRCTGFFCLAIIKGPPNDIYCTIEEPSKHYFTEKVSYSLPIFQIIYCVILFTLIIFRIALKNVGLYINLANYISMVVSIAFVFNTSIPKIHPEWRKNSCKTIFILTLLILIIVGFSVLVLNIDIPSVLNDIFTLIALMFCVCDKVFEGIIVWFASLF